MSAPEGPTAADVAAAVTARIAGVRGVTTVYARQSALGAIAGAVATAASGSGPAAPLVRVTFTDGRVAVDATIGVTDARPVRDVAEHAFDETVATLEDLGLTAHDVTIRVATID